MSAAPLFSALRPDPGRDGTGREATWVHKLVAEAVGTFLLTVVAAGADMVTRLHPHQVSPAGKAVAPGLVIMAMIYAVGDISGAHFNPVVTVSFALRGVFGWANVPGYWAAQLAGAVAAAGLLDWLLGPNGHLGAVNMTVTDPKAVVVETVMTAALVIVILNTANRHKLIGPDAAIAVGATIAAAGLSAGPLTGASMNPARSLGPALVSGHTDHLAVYLAGPLIGGLVAVAITYALHPHPSGGEAEAADGNGQP